MIRSMLEHNFSQFGRIETGNEERTALQPVKLQRQAQVMLRSYDRETLWDFDSNMTVLLILYDGEPLRFYFDRAIRIFAGTVFGFYPMAEESSILADPDAISAVCGTYPLLDNSSRISPMEIFTRLPQSGHSGLYFRGERHEPMELVYVKKGTLYQYCEGQQIILHSGQLLLIGPDQWHMQYAQEEVQELTVAFSWQGHDFSDRLCQAITATEEMRRNLRALQQTVVHGDAEEFYQAQLKLLLIQILQQPLRQEKRRKALPASERAHRDVLDRAMQAASAGVAHRLTVPKLAAAVNVSTSQLTALFQNYLGISPARYITRIRLEESKKMLTEGHLGVGEVAQLLGYSSVQHYSRQFRQWYGYTPTEFVKQKQQQGSRLVK